LPSQPSSPFPQLASTWEIDPNHTESSFVVKHLMVSNVRGQFGKTTGTVQQDDKDLTKSKVELTIDAKTIDTRVEKRDAHLKSPDFFDVEKFPTITFKSTKITKVEGNNLKMEGDLTIHGRDQAGGGERRSRLRDTLAGGRPSGASPPPPRSTARTSA
jgi:polyisoprenoid-binding protein YceI